MQILIALAFAGPVLMSVARNAWASQTGTQLVFILIGGGWLLTDALKHAPRACPPLWSTVALLVPALALYVFARITGIDWFAWIAVCATAAIVIHDRFGWRGLARAAVALGLLACMVPPPIEVVLPISDGVIAATSTLAVAILSGFGLDAALATPMLYIDQYELQVADACAGLGTVFSLAVCMLLYAYLRHRANWRRALFFAALAVPIALFANLIRILVIAGVIVTFGDTWAQGVLHDLAGLILFAIALVTLIAIDSLLDRVWR